jgi:hypothetical protein
MGKRLHAILEILSTVVTIAAGSALCWTLLTHHSRPTPVHPQLVPGTQVRPITDHSLSSEGPTALIFVRPGCHFCTASMPFYKNLLTAAARPLEKPVRIYFVSQAPVDATLAYLKENNVVVDRAGVANVSLEQYPYVTGTPTVLIVDPHGKLLKGWVGQVDTHTEQTILTLLDLT